VNWDEGSDFEWHELIGEGNYEEAIEEAYGVKYPSDCECDNAEKEWKEVMKQLRFDVVVLLKAIRNYKEPF
jgi:hypothetical protein